MNAYAKRNLVDEAAKILAFGGHSYEDPVPY